MSALNSKSERSSSNRVNRFVICALLVSAVFTVLGLVYIYYVSTAIGVAMGNEVFPKIPQALRDECFARDNFKLLVGEVDCTALAERDPPVASLLRSDRREDRIAAAFMLGECKELALAALDDLTVALNDSDPTVRAYAAYALRKLRHETKNSQGSPR